MQPDTIKLSRGYGQIKTSNMHLSIEEIVADSRIKLNWLYILVDCFLVLNFHIINISGELLQITLIVIYIAELLSYVNDTFIYV